ncbi:hypothetical protein LOK49_LG13G00136, partial [Camellia lanceoleosa]
EWDLVRWMLLEWRKLKPSKCRGGSIKESTKSCNSISKMERAQAGELTAAGFSHSVILIDGAWKTTTTDAGIAWICLNAGGHKLYQQALAVQPLPTPLAAEAMAYWEALRWAKDPGIETTHHVLVTMLQHKKEVQD